jgi:hypothetical protein
MDSSIKFLTRVYISPVCVNFIHIVQRMHNKTISSQLNLISWMVRMLFNDDLSTERVCLAPCANLLLK